MPRVPDEIEPIEAGQEIREVTQAAELEMTAESATRVVRFQVLHSKPLYIRVSTGSDGYWFRMADGKELAAAVPPLEKEQVTSKDKPAPRLPPVASDSVQDGHQQLPTQRSCHLFDIRLDLCQSAFYTYRYFEEDLTYSKEHYLYLSPSGNKKVLLCRDEFESDDSMQLEPGPSFIGRIIGSLYQMQMHFV